jgi:CPA2 family monovalent cation:H+ antiporter-2
VGSIISGQKLKTSIHTGFSLAQIGEFSFIIATLGMSLKITSDFLYPIAVAVSAITTFTTPYTMKLSFTVIPKIESALPTKLISILNNYYISMNTKAAKSSIAILWETYGIKITLNSIIIIAITLFSKHIVYAYLLKYYLNNIILLLSITLVTLFASAPFFWAIMFDTSMQVKDHESSTIQTIQNLLIGMTAFRLFVGLILTLFLLSQFIYIYFAILLTMAIIIIGTLFFRNLFSSYYLKLEYRFLKNLNQKEMDELHLKRKIPHLAPWDAVLTTFTVSPHSPICGLTLQDSKLKEKFNITIALIDRGGKLIVAPTRDTIIMNADRLHIIGSEEMLEKAGNLIELANTETDIDLDSYKLESLIIHAESPFINKSIKSCGIREKINGLIVGIERNGERILSPNSEMLLTENDLIWLVGDSRKLNEK